MTSLKQKLICSFCSKVYKSPFVLPCGDTLCEQHLKEENASKTNSIECQTCQKIFEINDNEMIRSNTTVKNLVDYELYLSDEEKSMKKCLEDSLRNLFDLNEQLKELKIGFDFNCHNHFQEIRRKIDLQREELKSQIDEISLALINQTKVIENSYMERMSEFKVEQFDLDLEIKSLNESFRDVNLSISSLKQLQSKEYEAIACVKSKLNSLSHLKSHLIKSNDFKPNLSFEHDSFGVINLSSIPEYSFESEILDKSQQVELILLCEFNLSEKWSLLYRGSRDGFEAKDFHAKCDGKSPTLTLIKDQGSGSIFGGYTEATWNTSEIYVNMEKEDSSAFLFSLKNNENKPCKMKCVEPKKAIFTRFMPVFGGNIFSSYSDITYGDIFLSSNPNKNFKSCSRLGKNYKHPEYAFESNEAKCFLAGSSEFQVSEIEIFTKG
jgi:hypothetical protein